MIKKGNHEHDLSQFNCNYWTIIITWNYKICLWIHWYRESILKDRGQNMMAKHILWSDVGDYNCFYGMQKYFIFNIFGFCLNKKQFGLNQSSLVSTKQFQLKFDFNRFLVKIKTEFCPLKISIGKQTQRLCLPIVIVNKEEGSCPYMNHICMSYVLTVHRSNAMKVIYLDSISYLCDTYIKSGIVINKEIRALWRHESPVVTHASFKGVQL